MPPPQTPASFPLHKFNHNVVSNTLVLSPRAVCIHTTASFPTSNGFLHLKRFKQSKEEWTMNCKNSAQNVLKVAIFRLKIEKFTGKGASILAPSAPRSSRLRRSTLPPPPFANPGSATGCRIRWLTSTDTNEWPVDPRLLMPSSSAQSRISRASFMTNHCLHGLLPGPFLLSYSVVVFSFCLFLLLCRAPRMRPGYLLSPFISLVHSLPHLFYFSFFLFFSFALHIFFFCLSLPFAPK